MKTRPSNQAPRNDALAAIYEDEPDDVRDGATDAWRSAPDAEPESPTGRERGAVVRALADLITADLERGAS